LPTAKPISSISATLTFPPLTTTFGISASLIIPCLAAPSPSFFASNCNFAAVSVNVFICISLAPAAFLIAVNSTISASLSRT